jgi:alkanesulfonate monooxygenase SsuD/methylene tetrahydromethanopterin reductase-like flavin-dependent oxidoreductase (luciferase family)
MNATRPGPIGFRIAATTPAADWQTLDAAWATAGESGAFDAAWISDHISDAGRERGGPAFESVATVAALAHRVPGHWIGVVVFANTFRHPALLAKSATVIDNATGGRFVLGMGAGWHAGEHDAFGIELGTPGWRVDRLESSLRVFRALFSPEAAAPPGVTLADENFPLRGATMEPGPLRPGGPPIWVGGQGRRAIGLAARYGDGWPMPGNRPGDVPYFSQKRDEIRQALKQAGRDPDDFTFAAQVHCAVGSVAETRHALDLAHSFIGAGATHLILAAPATAGQEGIHLLADELARPLRDELSRSATAP